MEDVLKGHILVVDDNKLNRMLMLRLLSDQGHTVTQAENGLEALKILRDGSTEAIDVVLLDIMMPELDGYGLLEKVKTDQKLRSIPVIMTSALDELDSVVRCIEIGATDYLTKPVQPGLLKARLKSSLAEKRLRDLELEYLEQVGYVVSAAESVEAESYDPESLRHVAMRKDALGRLARVFQKMAEEVHLREQRLKQQLAQLQLDIDEMQKALAEKLEIYIPMDRRQALVHGVELPETSPGAVLFADISDFTRLTNILAEELGRSRGAEEITRLINQIFTTLLEEVHNFKGSVISFSGDAITCWFDDSPVAGPTAEKEIHSGSLRATACAMFMQMAMEQFSYLASKSNTVFDPAIKVCVIAGTAHRHLVGNPDIQYLDVLFGETIEKLDEAEQTINRGEVLVNDVILHAHPDAFIIKETRTEPESGSTFSIIERLNKMIAPAPWEYLPENSLDEETCKPWIHPAVYEHAISPTRQFLSDLRPAAALFLQFSGIEIDQDKKSAELLNDYVSWLQEKIHDQGGAILQLSFGDKGSYLYASFGAPVSHSDDAVRAVRTALMILDKPAEFDQIFGEQIGISYGYMRTGAYGGDSRKTYGVIGNQTNLAARLMQAAESCTVLCDEETYKATNHAFDYEELPPINVKGRDEKVNIFRPSTQSNPVHEQGNLAFEVLDSYSPSEQMSLKMASVIGQIFTRQLLLHLLPGTSRKEALDSELEKFLQTGLIRKTENPNQYAFSQPELHDAIYQTMLYVQRRHIHRKIALKLESTTSERLELSYPDLAYHWLAAEEMQRAIEYYDKAGQTAKNAGDLEKAQDFFRVSLELSSSMSVENDH